MSLVNKIFHPLSTWPVLCNGGGPFRWQVGHISSLISLFSRHQCLFLFLFNRSGFRFPFQCEVWANMFSAFLQASEVRQVGDGSITYTIILLPCPYKVILSEIRAKHCASSLKVFICNFCLSSSASLSWLGTSFFSRVRDLWIRCMTKAKSQSARDPRVMRAARATKLYTRSARIII